jgi:hypothetical protein
MGLLLGPVMMGRPSAPSGQLRSWGVPSSASSAAGAPAAAAASAMSSSSSAAYTEAAADCRAPGRDSSSSAISCSTLRLKWLFCAKRWMRCTTDRSIWRPIERSELLPRSQGCFSASLAVGR